jgi:hypothetical protein
MKRRTTNPNYKDYSIYGGRGIKVCDEWKTDFAVFRDWAMANGYRDDLSIDRIDNNGNYEPSNCRWVDCKTQVKNRRNTLPPIVVNGEARTIKEWSIKTKLPYNVIFGRLSRGWPVKQALGLA